MKNRIFGILTVCTAFLLCAFTGCEMYLGGIIKFDAEVIDLSSLTFREDFLKANRTYGAHYENGGYDQTLPEFRTFVITEKAKLDEVFSVCPKIDFIKEMVVMYAYTSEYGHKRRIKNITLDNKTLKIKFKIAEGLPGFSDASMPITRFLVIKMDKLDIDTVEFTLLNP